MHTWYTLDRTDCTVELNGEAILAQTANLSTQAAQIDAQSSSIASLTSALAADESSVAAQAEDISLNKQSIDSIVLVDTEQSSSIKAIQSSVSAQSTSISTSFSAMTVSTSTSIRTSIDPVSLLVNAHSSTLSQQSAITAQNSIYVGQAVSSLTSQISTGDAANAALNAATSTELRALETCTLSGSIFDFVSKSCIRPNFAFASV